MLRISAVPAIALAVRRVRHCARLARDARIAVAVVVTGMLLAPSLAAAQQTSREQLHAVLWMQTAAEYRVLARQAWQLAAARLHSASEPGSAALEQWDMPAQQLAALPTAVIVDLDETVLDNSWFQARLVREQRDYSDADWDRWMAEEAATLIPGAREFLDEAARLGHRIFYVSNRECPRTPAPAAADPCPAKTWTLHNLRALGLPGTDDPANLLMRRERPEWSASDKTPRRAWLGQRYRIVEMVGDDIRDFVDRPLFDARRDELMPLFGERWFMLPNAMYGSWERALVDGACPAGSSAQDCAKLSVERKYALLQTAPPFAASDTRAWDGSRDRLRVATWNIEYLLEPATYAALAGSCVKDNSLIPGAVRQIPCDIVPKGDRKAADFAALRRYAQQLDADVIALEETDGPGAAAQVLAGYDYCFTSRPNVQKNGFAIRHGLPFRCDGDYLPISMDDAERRGVVVTLFPGTDNEITLLGVHLRSGCPDGPLTDEHNTRCTRLAAQLPALKAWVDGARAAGRRFAVLGDFNRRFTRERGAARDAAGRIQNLFAELNGDAPRGSQLTSIAATAPFRKCIPGDEYDSYIDNVVVGPALAPSIIKGSFQRVSYTLADAQKYRLSDHCPVGIEFRLH